VKELDAVTITAIAAAVVLIIGAFFAGIVSVVTAFKTFGSVKAIEGHVNSEKTAADGRELLLKNENALLREMLDERKTTAALLAQSTAMTAATPAATPAPAPTPPDPPFS
jgi:hypothetical protein